jgi:hypothetical protein
MPEAIPREVRAFTLGLIMGVGGSPYKPREITRLVKERFGVDVSTKTISNWKSNLPETMEKYKITDAYVKEVIDRGLFGDLREQGSSKELVGETVGKESTEPREEPKDDTNKKDTSADTVKELPMFKSIPEMISYMDGKGYLVGSERDIISQLEANGLTVFKKDQLHVGRQIFSWKPIELDLGAIGKAIATNPLIAFWYAVYRKACEDKGKEPADLVVYVTDCVNDANTSRQWNFALIRGEIA